MNRHRVSKVTVSILLFITAILTTYSLAPPVVEAAATIAISPISGSPPVVGPPAAAGTSFTVTGSGFAAGDAGPCTITGTPVDLATVSCAISASGVATGSFKLLQGSTATVSVTITVHGIVHSATFPINIIPQIALSLASAASGVTVAVAGAGFTGSVATCTPGITGPAVGVPSCSENSAGVVLGQFTVLNFPGSSFVTVTDTGGATASKAFTVTGGPSAILSSTSGSTGTPVTVTGSGWNSLDSSVSLHTSSGPVALFSPDPKTCTVSSGSITGCSFTVSSTALGAIYTITFTGSQGDSTTASFEVLSTLFISPSSGPAGTVISLSGTGYKASAGSCTGYFDSNPTGLLTVNSCTISSSGVLTGSATVVNTATPGGYTIIETNAAHIEQVTLTAPFTVSGPTITLNPNPGVRGSVVTITGSGFSTGDFGVSSPCAVATPTNIVAAGSSCTWASDGSVSGTFTVKGNAAPGVYTVTVTGSTGDLATATFTVNGPTITLTPNSGPVGTVVSVTGSGFITTDACPVTRSSSPTGLIGSFACSSVSPQLVASFTVQNVAAGTYTVTIDGGGGSADSASTTFTLTAPTPTVTLNPNSGPKGTSVTISGSGFNPGDVGTFTPCASSLPTNIVAAGSTCTWTSGGSVSGSFTITNGAAGGAYTIIVTGSTGDSASTAFTVTGPSITLSPNSGPVGTVVSVSGSGFKTTDSCPGTISSSPAGLIGGSFSCGSFSSGQLTASFTVQSGSSGTYTVTFDGGGGSGDTAQAAYTVTTSAPTISLTPTLGPAGTTVTVSGSGFAPADVGTIGSCSSGVYGISSPTLPAVIASSASCTFTAGGVLNSFSFTVGSVAPGLYVIQVTGSPAGDSAQATFTVTSSPTPTITLTPVFGPQGAVISVTGSGFSSADAAGSPFPGCITSSPTPIVLSSSCSFTPNGLMTGTLTVTTGALLGGYIITATGPSGDFASASFTVTSSTPTIVLSPSGGPTGITVTATASGFNPSDGSIAFTTSPSTLTPSFSCIPTNGGCTKTFVVTGSTGGYIVTGTGDSGDTASAAFTVGTSTSFVTFNPSSGPSGTLVSFSGAVNVNGATSCTVGGGSGSGLSIKTSSCIIVGNPSYPSFFSGSFVVGNQNPGAYSVKITTSGGRVSTISITLATVTTTTTGINYVQATFIVTGPAITLIPSSGRTGTTVSVTGVGFSFSDNTCTLSSTPSFVTNGQCTINGGTGVPSASFIVSNVAPGTYKLRVTGNTGDFAEAAFMIISGPTITLTPSNGAVGVTVAVTGVGFLPAGSSCSISGTPVRTPACTLATGTGAPAGSFTMSNVAPGSYVITLKSSAGDSAQAILTVTSISATLIFSLTQGGAAVSSVSPGATVYVRIGTGQLTSTATTCTLSSSPGGLFASAVCHIASGGTDLTGTFFMVAAAPSGNTYQVTVTDNIGSTAVGTIGIIFAPSLTLTPTYGSPGDTISFIGRGLLSTDTSCTVTSTPSVSTNGAQLQTSVSCSMSGGTASGTFVVNSLATADGSPWTVTVTGNPSSDAVTAQFTVVPVITVTPTNGVFGAVASVTGSGFSSKAVSGGCTLGSTPGGLFASSGCNIIVPGPNGNGQISGTFTVATGIPAGTYVVTASDGKGNSASTTFTIGTPTASVTVNPSVIAPPSSGTVSVSVTGFGFNGVDTGCTVTVSSPITVSGTCTMSGGNGGATLLVPANTPAGLYLVTITGTPNGDFASNYLAITTVTTMTSTTSTTSVSTTATSTTTLTTFTSISSSLTTTTITSTGGTTIVFTQGTQTTVSGITTSTVISIGYTTFPTTQQTTTTETHTLGQIIGPSVNGLGIFGTLLLLVAVLWRRFFT